MVVLPEVPRFLLLAVRLDQPHSTFFDAALPYTIRALVVERVCPRCSLLLLSFIRAIWKRVRTHQKKCSCSHYFLFSVWNYKCSEQRGISHGQKNNKYDFLKRRRKGYFKFNLRYFLKKYYLNGINYFYFIFTNFSI